MVWHSRIYQNSKKNSQKKFTKIYYIILSYNNINNINTFFIFSTTPFWHSAIIIIITHYHPTFTSYYTPSLPSSTPSEFRISQNPGFKNPLYMLFFSTHIFTPFPLPPPCFLPFSLTPPLPFNTFSHFLPFLPLPQNPG